MNGYIGHDRSPKRALIPGITGQDGSYPAEFLLDQGYEVHGTVRRTALEVSSHPMARIQHLLGRIEWHAASINSLFNLSRCEFVTRKSMHGSEMAEFASQQTGLDYRHSMDSDARFACSGKLSATSSRDLRPPGRLNVIAVIPTYNERANIAGLVTQVLSISPAIRILVVDDGSPDGTADEVRSLQEKFPQVDLLSRQGERGLGSAYLAGFRWALARPECDAVLMMDADHSHDPRHIPALLSRLQTCDAAVGSRYIKHGGVQGWELSRQLLSRFANVYIRFVTGMRLRDCTAGFNLIRADVLRNLDLDGVDCTGYAFITDIKHCIWRSGAAISEVPIVFKQRAAGESKLSRRIIAEGIRAPWRMRNKLLRSKVAWGHA